MMPQKIELTSLGLIKVSGHGAKKLLQGQLTCDLEKLTPAANHTLGAYCNPQGRVVSFFKVILGEDHYYYLQLPKLMIPLTLNALKKFAPFYQVTLEEVSEAEQAQSHFSENHPKWHDIQAGIVTLYPETSGKYLAHELGLHKLGAISFDKGCYSGQEIVSRMQYLGKLKNQLYRGTVKEITPQRGQDIYQAATIVGSIVDYCEIDYNNYDLLFIAQKQVVKKPIFLETTEINEIKQVISLFE